MHNIRIFIQYDKTVFACINEKFEQLRSNNIKGSLENEKLSDDDSVSTQEDREAHVPNPLPREKNRVKFEETDPKNRHSMQFVKSFSYTQLNSSDGESENEGLCELEHSNSRTITDPSHPQYVSKISLV